MEKISAAQKATDSKRSQTVDLMKLILSVFVVMIHAEVDLGILTPFLRTAVPLFFITSGYYFFRKLNGCGTDAERRNVMIHFLKRNMMLYGFWFVVLLPITLMVRDWYSGSFFTGVVKMLQSFLFNSTFRASWYIMALSIGMCISCAMSVRMTEKTQIFLTLPVYLLCCLFSNYYNLAARCTAIMNVYRGYISIFRSLCNSFPAALFWLSLGRYFAAGSPIKQTWRKNAVWVAVSAVALVSEYVLVSHNQWRSGDDAYVMLIPLCAMLFPMIQNIHFNGGSRIRMGHISTIIYTTHASVVTVVGVFVRKIPGIGSASGRWISFAVTMLICAVICDVIFRTEKFKKMRWLRYAY